MRSPEVMGRRIWSRKLIRTLLTSVHPEPSLGCGWIWRERWSNRSSLQIYIVKGLLTSLWRDPYQRNCFVISHTSSNLYELDRTRDRGLTRFALIWYINWTWKLYKGKAKTFTWDQPGIPEESEHTREKLSCAQNSLEQIHFLEKWWMTPMKLGFNELVMMYIYYKVSGSSLS